MKKTMALLLAAVLLLSCTPAMAVQKKYESPVLGATMILPDYLEVIAEIPAKDMNGSVIFFSMPDSNAQITATMGYVPEYVGLQTRDLPKEEIESWKELFTESYPKHVKSMLIKPQYHSSQRIYRFYGMSEAGNWMLSYSGVRDGLYVSVCCEATRFGFKQNVMEALFQAFNDCFQLLAMSRKVSFVPYSAEDYEVVIFNLLYDDSPDSIFWKY